MQKIILFTRLSLDPLVRVAYRIADFLKTSFAKPLEDLRSHLHLEVAFRFLSKAFYVEGARHNKIVKKGDIMNKTASSYIYENFL